MGTDLSTTRLSHGRSTVLLHPLSSVRDPSCPPLLVLHEIGGSSQDFVDDPPDWPGVVYALDFAGHGGSDPLRGGGYYPEYFLADADLALATIGADHVAVAGAGIGAYVAMMLAAARADHVPAALLMPGRGAACAGSVPDFEDPTVLSIEAWEARVAASGASYRSGTDPAVSACERDYRPDDYVESYAKAARALLLLDWEPPDVDVPSWWRVVARSGPASAAGRDRRAAFGRLAEAVL